MQNFQDTATGQYWSFDDDVVVTQSDGGLEFRSPSGGLLLVPPSLVPVDVIPEPEPPSQPRTIFSVREFRQRFTHEEQVAIRAASFSDMDVGLIYDEFLSAQYIDVADPATAAGIDLYTHKGLLDAARRDELLAPAFDEEVSA